LDRLGFSPAETDEEFDANKTLADVIKSKDARLLEGFPVLLTNAAQEYDFDYDKTFKQLTKKEEKEDFRALLLLTFALFQYYHISFYWSTKLLERLAKQDVAYLKNLKNALTHDKNITLGNKHFHSYRFKEIFNNYFEQDKKKTRELKANYEDLSFEYALSQVFSPKQKELFKKKLYGNVLNKTEREYYSRTVKRKVAALANPELHRLAQKLMEH